MYVEGLFWVPQILSNFNFCSFEIRHNINLDNLGFSNLKKEKKKWNFDILKNDCTKKVSFKKWQMWHQKSFYLGKHNERKWEYSVENNKSLLSQIL